MYFFNYLLQKIYYTSTVFFVHNPVRSYHFVTAPALMP